MCVGGWVGGCCPGPQITAVSKLWPVLDALVHDQAISRPLASSLGRAHDFRSVRRPQLYSRRQPSASNFQARIRDHGSESHLLLP